MAPRRMNPWNEDETEINSLPGVDGCFVLSFFEAPNPPTAKESGRL